MLIKAGVYIDRLDRKMCWALNRIGKAYKLFKEEVIITSTYEGNHMDGSLHYCNKAIDIRLPQKNTKKVLEKLLDFLGEDFDLVYYDTHFHIEYDP